MQGKESGLIVGVGRYPMPYLGRLDRSVSGVYHYGHPDWRKRLHPGRSALAPMVTLVLAPHVQCSKGTLR